MNTEHTEQKKEQTRPSSSKAIQNSQEPEPLLVRPLPGTAALSNARALARPTNHRPSVCKQKSSQAKTTRKLVCARSALGSFFRFLISYKTIILQTVAEHKTRNETFDQTEHSIHQPRCSEY